MNSQQQLFNNHCNFKHRYSSIIYVQTTLNDKTIIDKITREVDADKYGEDITYIDRQLKYHDCSDDDLLRDSQNRTGMLISYIIDSQSVLDDTIKVLFVSQASKYRFRTPIQYTLSTILCNISIGNKNIEDFHDNTDSIGDYVYIHV